MRKRRPRASPDIELVDPRGRMTSRAEASAIVRRSPGTFPGWGLMVAVATASYVLSELLAPRVTSFGRSLVEPVTLAIIAGLLLRNMGWVHPACDGGIKHYEVALKLGIVLLGLSLTFLQAVQLGAQTIFVVIICLAISPAFIYVIAKWFHVPQKLGILLGVGTTICGSTAIAIAAPAIEARDEEVSYSIGTISFFGILAMLVLPLAGTVIRLTESEFGILAGTSMSGTPQVLGVASMYGNGAVAHATIVKMTRNIFMIPAVFLLGVWYARQKAHAAGRHLGISEYRKAVPAFLFGFLALAVVRSLVDHFEIVPRDLWASTLGLAAWTAKFLILMAMAGIGLNTRFAAMRRIGVAPLLVGFIGALFLGLLSYTLIRWLGLGGRPLVS